MKRDYYAIESFKGLDSRPDAADPQTLSKIENVSVTDEGSLRLFGGAAHVLSHEGKARALLDYTVAYHGRTTLVFTSEGKILDLHGLLDLSYLSFPEQSIHPLWVDRLTINGQDCIVCATQPPTVIFISADPDASFVSTIGVSNPAKEWDSPNEHAVWIDPAGAVRHEERPGIPLFVGRGYRWSWHNPRTNHDSTLQPLYQGVEEHTSGTVTSSFTPSYVEGDPDHPFVREFILTLNGEDAVPLPMPYPAIGGEEYSHIRFWATGDGSNNWYLIPRLYDKEGNLLTDEHGAIPLDLPIRTLSDTVKKPFPIVPADPLGITCIYDGWMKLAGDGWCVNEQDTGYLPSGKGGTHLVIKDGEAPLPGYGDYSHHGDKFTLEGSDVVFTVVGHGTEPNEIILDKRLDSAFPGGVEGKDGELIAFKSFTPVSDSELYRSLPWIDGETGHNPPPSTPTWGTVFGQRLWFAEKNKLYFSIPGQYFDFPDTNYLTFQDEITGLALAQMISAVSEGLNQRLLVGTKKQINQVILLSQEGYDFNLRPFLTTTGVFGPRTWTISNGILFGVTGRGIEVLDEQRQIWVGREVKDIIPEGTKSLSSPIEGPILYDGSELGLIVVYSDGTKCWPGSYEGPTKALIMRPLEKGKAPSYSLFCGNKQGPISSVYMSHASDHPTLYWAYGNGTIWKMFEKKSIYGYPRDDVESPYPATGMVRSQILHFKLPGITKIFYEVWSEEDIRGFSQPKIRFSVDQGVRWTPYYSLADKHFIGLIGDSLMFELLFNPLVPIDVMLKSLIFTYAAAGRGQSMQRWRIS